MSAGEQAQIATQQKKPIPEALVYESSNSRLRGKARKMGGGVGEFVRFARLWACVPSKVSPEKRLSTS